jgi:hypothetical protein
MISQSKVTDVIEEPISLNILIPGYRVQAISVLRSSSIQCVKRHLPNTELIFNGQILNNKCTLDFYHIQPNDSIVALSADQGRAMTEN